MGLSSHGGHMGNHICARNGTRIVEFCCAEKGWFSNAGKLHKLMGFKWKWVTLPDENCLHTSDNAVYDDYLVPEKVVSRLVRHGHQHRHRHHGFSSEIT